MSWIDFDQFHANEQRHVYKVDFCIHDIVDMSTKS